MFDIRPVTLSISLVHNLTIHSCRPEATICMLYITGIYKAAVPHIDLTGCNTFNFADNKTAQPYM